MRIYWFQVDFSLEVISSTIQENITGHSGGGIYNEGVTLIQASTIISNSAPYDGLGGGIFNKGLFTVTNSTVNGNSVSFDAFGSNGGGIFNHLENAEITIENSTISRNSSNSSYGGFANYGGIARLTNVTISENDHGGVIQFNGGTTYITNSSIISNFHNFPQEASLRVIEGSVSLVNTIIAGETATENCIGTINSVGNNLESGSSCGFSSTGDITNTNPLVGPLQWNGGNTQTHALQTGSPAIDAGNDATCPLTDQRGESRPSGIHCDIGAYEFNSGLTAIDDTMNTIQNIPVLIPVLENDQAGDNGEPFLDSVGIPMSGTAVISGTFVLYTPTFDILGTDVFSYTISDGVYTDTANIFVTIRPIEETFYIYLPAILKPE